MLPVQDYAVSKYAAQNLQTSMGNSIFYESIKYPRIKWNSMGTLRMKIWVEFDMLEIKPWEVFHYSWIWDLVKYRLSF